jgi:hypothetical protein
VDIGKQALVEQMKHCFVVTSAINSRFGVYSPLERLEQTVTTIASIRKHVPNAKIVLMEVTGVPTTPEQVAILSGVCDVYLDFTDEVAVQTLYNSTENWDVVKNGTEIMCFGQALKMLKADEEFEGIDRIHKMSGRYLINEQFDNSLYEQEPSKIIIGRKHKSQFPLEVTQQGWQYMARLWSWPVSLLDEVITVYDQSLAHFNERVANGGYTDIEHVLAKFLPTEHVVEVDQVGVEGTIAPNGAAIRN